MNNTNLSKMTNKAKKAKSDRKTNYYRKWRKAHPNYFKNYYKKHSKIMIASSKKYIESAKGKATVLKYEHTEKRMKAKRDWQRKKRSRHD